MREDVNSFWTDGELPPTFWHYTSAAGLLGILKEGKIWASDVRFLNDVTEDQKMWTLLRKRVDERVALGAEDTFLDEEILPKFSDNLSTQWKDEKDFHGRLREDFAYYLQQLQTKLKSKGDERIFVTCVSQAKDSLSQWRAYTSGSGYAIGFSPNAFLRFNVTDPKAAMGSVLRGDLPGRFAKVKYLSEEHVETVDSVINVSGLFRWIKGDTGISFASTLLDTHSPFIKDSRFSEEEEWRLAFTVRMLKRTPVEFRPGRSHLIPYLEVPLSKGVPNYIQEIMVGPGPSSELDVVALKDLKEVRDLNIEVTRSEIPYRNW
jgi:hypothetical protein